MEGLDPDKLKEEYGVLKAKSLEELDKIRVELLGKKGKITSAFKQMKDIAEDKRKEFGQKINEAKEEVSSAIEKRKAELEDEAFNEQIRKDKIDVTLPGRRPLKGKLHILHRVEEEVVSVLRGMGFTPVSGPELEDDYHNFEALNIPYYHPARDDHDTIYIDDTRLLRTHTSPVQVRTMKNVAPPIAIVSPGKCARNDSVDATHSPVFHQIEGLFVDAGVTFADLKGCLLTFCKRLFGSDVKIRLRPDFFPFVEPGADISVTCMKCGGSGCPTCKKTGYIEILGAGMVHPKVFEHVGYDYEKYSGFAFGVGIERITMIKYGIPDIRLFYENDADFIRQF